MCFCMVGTFFRVRACERGRGHRFCVGDVGAFDGKHHKQHLLPHYGKRSHQSERRGNECLALQRKRR